MLEFSLYPKISESQPELSGKITGMLLEMDSSELLYLLENDEALQAKVRARFFFSLGNPTPVLTFDRFSRPRSRRLWKFSKSSLLRVVPPLRLDLLEELTFL